MGALSKAGRIKKALIISPLSVTGVWLDELRKFADFDYAAARLEGTSVKKADTLRHMKGVPLQIVICNYESTWRIESALLKYNADIVVADESHKIKTHNSKQSKAMHKIGARARYRIMLTGTLITNKALDVFSQYKFAEPSVFGNSFYAFRNRYFNLTGYENRVPVLKKTMEAELTERIHSIAFRVTKAQCLDLPATMDIIRYVEVDLTVDTTLKKKQKLRNNEYYDMQNAFDKLYEKSVNGKDFAYLMKIISCEDNILLAYRNIKNNKGSMTKGTDGRTIEHYKDWSEEKFVEYFKNKFANYHPKSVRRVEIPKDYQPGKTRPLGIPCMDDRIIQQCILQVLEPICEAKFHNHSYGFRPNRSTSHAIARAQYLMWHGSMHHVVDIDIKGFFDNVDHGKLLKQMWNLGIRDKSLISIIGKILKSEIKGIGKPEKGTPQGGIISPLLSNIVLNELDWWLSNQWETKPTKHRYSSSNNTQKALKTTDLKQIFFVRYADDFKILCRDYKTARKIFIATKDWLKERLGLEISPEKSNITNVRKGKTTFLGFELFIEKKKKEFVTRSNISVKAKQTMQMKLKNQVKSIQHKTSPHQVNMLNSMILGMHVHLQINCTE